MERNHLNDSDVDGNTIAWMLDSPGDAPEWYCKECDNYVREDEFNHKRHICYSCWWKI